MLLWFAPRFFHTASSLTPDLRMMTNNIWHLNDTPENVAQLIQEAQPDVVFLQEVGLATQGDALAVLNAAYPYQTQTVDEIRAWQYQAVNLTLSRYPFVESELIELGLPDMPVIYRNVIEVDGQRVALYNVHLITPDNGKSRWNIDYNYFLRVMFSYNDRERNRQIDTLLRHLATEPLPYIVAGDFNTSDFSVTYTHIAAHMRDSFAEIGYGFGATWPFVEALGWPSFLPAFIRMDYIWHSAGLQTVRAWQGGFVGSDHLPVLAEFAFETR